MYLPDNSASIIVFSSYPRQGFTHGVETVGGASYTKVLFTKLKELQPDLLITIFSEVLTHKTSYEEDGLHIHRIWTRNNILSLISTIFRILKNPSKTIVVSYEINMVGGIITNFIFLSSLLFINILGKKIYFIPHQVLDNFEGVEEERLKKHVLNFFKTILFKWISFVSYKIFVFEEYFRYILPDKKKVIVVPLAIEQAIIMDNKDARNRLKLQNDDFIMLFFGFLSHYKGLDQLLVSYSDKICKLIIAGDGNPNHMENYAYNEYIQKIKKEAISIHALVTGFIKEEDIPLYYSSADVVVFPYKKFFSSSFPLSLAFSYEKPVLLSKQLTAYFQSPDFKEALQETKLKSEDFILDFTQKELIGKLEFIRKNRQKFVSFAKIMKQKRNWNSISQMYLKELRSN